jgi:hypothetical protein
VTQLESLLWLLPVLFMLHDFEEIIMLRPWLTREAGHLAQRFPFLAARALPHLQRLSTSAFAVAVAEEFVLLSFLTWLVVERAWYALWAGVTLAFFIHLVVHAAQFVVYGRYVPAIVSSAVVGPLSLLALCQVNASVALRWPVVAGWTGIALVAMAANVALAHVLAARFEAWLQRRFARQDAASPAPNTGAAGRPPAGRW